MEPVTTSRSSERINLSAPHMTSRERNALLAAFESNWIAPAGPALREFEAQLCEVSHRDAAIGVSSGTAALHLALLALEIGPGDIVLCPSVTFVASANVIGYVGATPHFVDCDRDTGNMSPEALAQALADLTAIGHRPAAVMTVDLYGSCADYSSIVPICERFGVPIVEDAAEAIGATHHGRPAGSFGVLAAYSFNGNKLITTGGGGGLVGPRHLIDRAAFLAGQAREPEVHFEHRETGYAYRLSNLSAALGCAQLERLDAMITRTRSIYRRYVEELGSIQGVHFAPQDRFGRGNGWLSVAHIDTAVLPTPATICHALLEENIEARPAWKPMHMQPLYTSAGCTGTSGAERHFRTGLCLPSGSSMNASAQSRVIAAIRRALNVPAAPAADTAIVLEATPTIDIADAIDIRNGQSRQHRDNQAPTH